MGRVQSKTVHFVQRGTGRSFRIGPNPSVLRAQGLRINQVQNPCIFLGKRFFATISAEEIKKEEEKLLSLDTQIEEKRIKLEKLKDNEEEYIREREEKIVAHQHTFKGEEREEMRLGVLGMQQEEWEPDHQILEETKEEIYKQYCSDPIKYHLEHLSVRYDLSLGMVSCIIMIKKLEEHYVARTGQPLDRSVYEAKVQHYPEVFDIFGRGEGIQSHYPDEKENGTLPGYTLLEPEVDKYEFLRNTPKRFDPQMLANEIPPHPDDFDHVDVIRPPVLSMEETQKLREHLKIPEPHGRIFFYDTHRSRRHGNRIWVTDLDGTIRTASWRERKDFFTKKKKTLNWRKKVEDLWNPITGTALLDRVVDSILKVPIKVKQRERKRVALRAELSALEQERQTTYSKVVDYIERAASEEPEPIAESGDSKPEPAASV